MLTRELIADVQQTIKKLSLDDRIPKQFIYLKLIEFTSILIKRETDNRKLFKQTHLFQTINLDLKKYKTGLSISTAELPPFFTGSFGNLLMVGSEDLSNSFKPITLDKFVRIQRRRFKDENQIYYWIEDNKLVVTNEYLFCVPVKGLFHHYNSKPCGSLLDTEFPCPDYLLGEVINLSVQALSIRERIIEDENPNLDSNNK